MPDGNGCYKKTPESLLADLWPLLEGHHLNIVGGCCGTTEEFIARYVPLVEGKQPHVPAPKPQNMWLSGLELLEIENSLFYPRKTALFFGK